jgi:hypothetical protein
VLELNKLKQKAGEELLETEERKNLCERIVLAGVILGLAYRRLK